MLLFNFQDFISEMREKADKKEIVEKYEQLYGPIQGDIYDQVRYTDYLSKFSQSFYFTRYHPYFQIFTKNIFKKN